MAEPQSGPAASTECPIPAVGAAAAPAQSKVGVASDVSEAHPENGVSSSAVSEPSDVGLTRAISETPLSAASDVTSGSSAGVSNDVSPAAAVSGDAPAPGSDVGDAGAAHLDGVAHEVAVSTPSVDIPSSVGSDDIQSAGKDLLPEVPPNAVGDVSPVARASVTDDESKCASDDAAEELSVPDLVSVSSLASPSHSLSEAPLLSPSNPLASPTSCAPFHLATTPASPAPEPRETPTLLTSSSFSDVEVLHSPAKRCVLPMQPPPPPESQLEFEEGQLVHVLDRVSSDWWWGELDGKQGYVRADMVEPAEPPSKWCTERHVMMMSRGTRGDVQPFVALARGLAEQLGWMVTICTELRWKDFVKENSVVSRGCIRFRPSGGDTMMRTNTMLAKWAMQHKSELMQVSMLARCEGEFFDSEPILFHWAKELRPDLLIYGFTLTNVAMIISEAQNIPMMGFVLQPTCLPSHQYPTVTTISSNYIQEHLSKQVVGHGFQQALKMMMENNPITAPLNAMRKKRNLQVFSGFLSETWSEIISQNSPVIVPISPFAFGGKPEDWHENASLTEFIFLRGGGTPKIAPDLSKFLADAKAAHEPTVVMGFSSMPVPREDIMNIAHKMIEDCACKPRVIALVGQRDMSKEHLSAGVEEKQIEYIKQGKLFEAAGAPFGLLFELVDCIIMHGGLGTTAEALRAAKPTITTGVLLMDQRFWGQRVHDLGVGPPPVHISDFIGVCAEFVDKALVPSDESSHFTEWQQNAMAIAPKIQGLTPDGVRENVQEVVRLAALAKPIRITNSKTTFCEEDDCSNPTPCPIHQHLSR